MSAAYDQATPPASAPTLPDDPEAALIAAEAEITRRYEWLERHRATLRRQDEKDDEETVQAPVYDSIERLEDFITATPVTTLAGAAVKLRRVLDASVGIYTGACSEDATSLAHVLTLVQSIAGGPSHPTRPIVTFGELRMPPFDVSVPASTPGSDNALSEAERRLIALEAFWDAQSNPPDDAYADEVDALQHFIAETPAMGIEGIRVKFARVVLLSGLSRTSVGSGLIETLKEAIERLAGRAS